MVAPQGARQVEYANGLSLFVGRDGKPLALVDSESHLYVTAKGKTIEEDKNGNIFKDTNNCGMEKDLKQTFLPGMDIIYDSGKKNPLKPGKVAEKDFSDYGIERSDGADGAVTKFANGVEVTTGRADLKVPPGSKVENDSAGAKVFDDKGHPIAQVENNGVVHVYTPDGTFTEKPDGSVTFSKEHPHFKLSHNAKNVQAATDGDVHLQPSPEQKKRTADAMENLRKVMEKCKDSNDPLCGIDITGL